MRHSWIVQLSVIENNVCDALNQRSLCFQYCQLYFFSSTLLSTVTSAGIAEAYLANFVIFIFVILNFEQSVGHFQDSFLFLGI